MPISYLEFRKSLYPQGIFSLGQVRLYHPLFNTDNLLSWQGKGYITRLRRGWYVFNEYLKIPEFSFLVANTIYSPSYISHQEALLFYGLIPEHIIDSTSITTKKTNSFQIAGRTFKYYSIHPRLYFGYELKEMTTHGIKRNYLIANREKAILDLLYIFDFYKTNDIPEIRFNEVALENDISWDRMEGYLQKFGMKVLDRKVQVIRKIYRV